MSQSRPSFDLSSCCKKVVKSGVVVLALSSIFGCSSTPKEKPADLVEFEAKVGVHKVWSADAGAGQNKKRYSRLYPTIVDGTIYVSDTRGQLFGFEAETGERVWRAKTDYEISGSLAVAESRAYFGTLGAQAVAVDIETGEELWNNTLTSEVLATPVSDGKSVVFQTADSRLFCFDAKTGEKKWQYDHVAPALSLRTTSSPVIHNDDLYAAFDNGQMVKFNLESGSVNWVVRIAQPKGGSELERIVDVDARPLINGSLVFSASYQGNILALKRANGELLWNQPESTFNDLAVGASTLVSVSDESVVTARSLYSGSRKWENSQMRLRDLGAPAILGDYVAVIDFSNYIHVLDAKTGEFVARHAATGNGFRSSPTVYRDTLILLSDSGVLSAYRVQPQ